jgi:hypothetical protein
MSQGAMDRSRCERVCWAARDVCVGKLFVRQQNVWAAEAFLTDESMNPGQCHAAGQEQSFVLSCEQVPGTPQPSEFVEEFVQPDGGPRVSLGMESSRRVICSGARCWRKRSVCEIPFRKIVLELGIPIGSDVFVEKIQQSLDFRRQP